MRKKRNCSRVTTGRGVLPLYRSRNGVPQNRRFILEGCQVNLQGSILKTPIPSVLRGLRNLGVHESRPVAKDVSRKPRTLLVRGSASGKVRKALHSFLRGYLHRIDTDSTPDAWYLSALTAAGRWERRLPGDCNGWYPIPVYGPALIIPTRLVDVVALDGPG